MERTLPYLDHFDGRSPFIDKSIEWDHVQGHFEVLKTATRKGLQVRVLSPPFSGPVPVKKHDTIS
jgi:hypothetical protein